jgi:hypothetical protein
LEVTTSLAWNALIKQPGKLAYHIIRPKDVELGETDGLWRLDQQIGAGDGPEWVVASVATIELHANSRTATLRKKDDTYVSDDDTHKDKNTAKKPSSTATKKTTSIVSRVPYTFTKKRMSGSYQTSFVMPAFLIGDDTMRLYGYKGTWQRKVANRDVLKLVGKIYQVHQQRFGKHRGEYVFGPPIGTFVARRRIQLLDEDDDDDDDDDDGDEDYEEDDDGEEEDVNSE